MNRQGALLWIVLIGLSCFFLGFMANRWIQAASEGSKPTYLERLEKDLGLSADQKIAIADHLTKEDAAIREILKQYRDPMSRKIQAVRDETRDKIRDVLDPSQRALFDGGGNFSR